MTRPLDQIKVAWRERAFDGPVNSRMIEIRDGERWPTVAEIVMTTPELPARFVRDGEVRINGELVPRSCWHLVRPKLAPGRGVGVTLHLPLRGGGGGQGNKNILALVATIAVLLVAAAVSGGALALIPGLAGLLPFSVAAGSIGASVLGAAVGLAGALAIGALTKPPTITDPGGPATDADGKPASLSGNVLAPGAAVPRVIGTRRVFPPLASQPLNELVGDDENVEAVMVLAGKHALSAVRLGDANSSDMTDVTVELQDGRSTIQSLVSRQARTIPHNFLMSQHKANGTTVEGDTPVGGGGGSLLSQLPKWEPFVSRIGPDEIWIRLQFPEGIIQEATPATRMNVPVRVRIRRRGDSTWINLPEIHFSSDKPVPFQKDIRIVWATAPTAANVPPSTGQGPFFAFNSVTGQNGTSVTPATASWTAHSNFSLPSGGAVLSSSTLATTSVKNVELYQHKAVFYLDAATFPQNAPYEIQVRRGCPYVHTNFTPATYVYASLVRDFFEYQNNTGTPSVPIDLQTVHHRVVLSHISSIWNENPIQSSDFATVSVKARGRQLDQISVLASGYTYDWDGSGWNTLTTTSNPVPHFREVLGGTLSADPMPADMIDDTGLVAWRTHCTSMGYTVNAVIDGRSTRDVLELIASCGYAKPRMSEKWGVALDKNRSAEPPVQIFSPRNMRAFGFSRGFPQMPSGFRVRFDNIDDDYKEDEIVVDDVEPLPDQATRYEQVRYDGFVDEDDARARALFDLEQARRRFVFYRGEVPVEALVCVRGDLVGVQHDVIRNEAGYARVLAVRISGSNVTGLILDGTIPVPTEDAWSDPGLAWSSYSSAWRDARTGVAIRLKDQTSIVKEVTAVEEEAREIDFVTPFAHPGATVLTEDCLVVSGLFGSEYQRMLVLDVTPIADMAAAMTFVPEAPELWS